MDYRMRHYTTFFITRHPFDRLVSAYYDKLSAQSTYQSYKKKYGMLIARQQAKIYLNGIKNG